MFSQRAFTLLLVAASVLWLSGIPAAGKDLKEEPSRFFPPHTYLYLETNPWTACEGFRDLKIANLLEDPTIAQLFNELLTQMPPEYNPGLYVKAYQLDEIVGDSVALGSTGVTVHVRTERTSEPSTKVMADGTRVTSEEVLEEVVKIRYPAKGSISADVFRRAESFEANTLVAIEVKDRLRFIETVINIMKDSLFNGEEPEPELFEVKGFEILKWPLPIPAPKDRIYSAFSGDYFLVTRDLLTLTGALHRSDRRTASLGTRADFSHFKKHRKERPAGAMLHLGVHDLIELLSPLIPPADLEELNKWGLMDFSGLQLGFGFHEGALLEWFHLAFAENPKGLLMNLMRLWPSTSMVARETPRGTVYAASLDFDWTALYNVTMFILDLCEVDTSELTEGVKANLGLDLREDILGAFGTEVGAIMVMPRYGVIPEFSLAFSVRNRAKMEKVLATVDQIYAATGLPTKRFTMPGGGPKGTYVDLGQQIPVKPAFALTGDYLVVSPMPLTLKYAVMKTGGESTLGILTEAEASGGDPLLSCFFDPGPMAMNLYADCLKILDSGSGGNLPVNVTDLPSPEFIAQSLSRIGFEFSVDAYFLSIDLHSPIGIALPLLSGAAAVQAMERTETAIRDV